MNTRLRTAMRLFIALTVLFSMLAVFGGVTPAKAIGTTILIDNLQPSWTALGGGGVYSAYYGPPGYGAVSPGSTAVYDGRQAGVIKAGLTVDPISGHYEDEGLFGFIPGLTINTLAAGPVNYDVENQTGANPVWMTIEIDTGTVGDRNDNTDYQHVPTANPAGWHTVDAAAGQWQMMDSNGNGTGPLMSLSDVATANTGLDVVRIYLRLGIGDSYHGTGSGTIGWVDKVVISTTTYDFVVPVYWYVSTTGSDSNTGSSASPFLTIQHAIAAAAGGDTIHVAPGTYVETGQMFINKNLSIVGTDKLTTIIQPGSDTAGSGDTGSWILVDNGITFNISGVTLDGTGHNIRQGIRYKGSGTVDNVIIQNMVWGDPGVDYLGWGIAMGYTSTTAMSLTVTNSTFTNFGRVGILVDKGAGAATATITGNTFTGKGDGNHLDYAIEIGGGASATVSDNTITNCRGVASSDGSTSAGIYVHTYFGTGTTALLTANTITGNTYGIAVGYETTDTAAVTAYENEIHDNSELNIYTTSSTVTVDAQGNWFGSSADPDATTDGLVDDNGWCSTDECTSFIWRVVGTIQAAVNAAFPGDTVMVGPGTYVEQVIINKDLVLSGAGRATTIIQSPDDLAVCFTTSASNCPIIYIKDGADVTIEHFTIDGAGNGNLNYRFVGVAFQNAGGAVSDNTIQGVRDATFSGAQGGVPVYAYNNDSVARTIDVVGNTITDFQKTGLALNTNDVTPLDVLVKDNLIEGHGTTGVTAQNGIQVWGDLTTGSVEGNTISGIGYSGSYWVATTILNYYAELSIIDNTITGAQVGIYNIDGSAEMRGNNITVEPIGDWSYGIVATDPPQAVPAPFDNPGLRPEHVSATGLLGPVVSSDVHENTVIFSGLVNDNSTGIEADSGYGVDNVRATITHNIVQGFGYGIGLWQCETGCSTGEFRPVEVHLNQISGNDVGLDTNLAGPINAEQNWWGNVLGPTEAGNPAGTGDSINGNVDYIQWCANPECTIFLPPFSTTSTTILSAGGQDGWIRESGEGTGIGGGINVLSGTFMLGDDLSDRQYRSVLSFNTAGLPDTAVVSGVTLKIRLQGTNGTNPYSWGGNLYVDADQTLFGTTQALVKTDFEHAADYMALASITDTNPGIGGWYSVDLPAGTGNYDYVKLTSPTQLRLRFNTATNGNNVSDRLKFFSGNAVRGSRPQLIVTYSLPSASATFPSLATTDGWVRESVAGSGIANLVNAGAATTIVGDDTANRQYRTILSFNTAALPDTALINSVTLKVKQSAIVGTDPFALGDLWVDTRSSFFGALVKLQFDDFWAGADHLKAATILSDSYDTGWYSVTLPASAFDSINVAGTTQLRLRFDPTGMTDGLANQLVLFSGNAGATSKPILIVGYTVP